MCVFPPERSVEMDHLLVLHVRDDHVERSQRTVLPGEEVTVLFGEVDLLAAGIEEFVLVGSLVPSGDLQLLNLLFDFQLVQQSEIIQAGRTVWRRLGWSWRCWRRCWRTWW